MTSASARDDVAQILYGLSIRGVRADAIENTERAQHNGLAGSKPDRYLIVLADENPLQSRIARESIISIWDAILEQHPRAVTLDQCCSFCGYNLAGLPRPTVCPECGVDVDSIAARRAMRDRSL